MSCFTPLGLVASILSKFQSVWVAYLAISARWNITMITSIFRHRKCLELWIYHEKVCEQQNLIRPLPSTTASDKRKEVVPVWLQGQHSLVVQIQSHFRLLGAPYPTLVGHTVLLLRHVRKRLYSYLAGRHALPDKLSF